MKKFSYKRFLSKHYPKEKLNKILEDDKNLIAFTKIGDVVITMLDFIEDSSIDKKHLIEIVMNEYEAFYANIAESDSLDDNSVYEYFEKLLKEFKEHYVS